MGRARRGRHRHDQLHERHHGPAQGRAAHAPQPVDQLDHLRLAHGSVRSRRLPAHAADVPLQRLGHALRAHRHGRAAGRHTQGRRRRHPAADRPARRHASLRRAHRRVDGSRSGPVVGRAGAGARPHPHRRRRCAAAHPHHRAGGERAGLGVHPDLRPHRDHSPADHQPRDRPSGTTSSRPSERAGSAAPACLQSAST